MGDFHALRGGCACGRNEFIVNVPSGAIDQLQVLLDNSSLTSRHTTAPLTPFLRVPLEWYKSVTYAFFPDETHKSIRRTFAAFDNNSAQRQFCGFCGTQLNSWNEDTADNASHISVNLGSLQDEDVALLDDWGLLSVGDEETVQPRIALGGPVVESGSSALGVAKPKSGNRNMSGMSYRGTPWFEHLVQDSPLGRIRRQAGRYRSRDGNTSVQWEVVELASDGSELVSGNTFPPVKRKREDNDEELQADVHMKE